MSDQEQPNQPAGNEDESAPQQPAKKGFDTKFFLMVLSFSLVFMLISQTPLLGLGLFWFNKTGLPGNYSGTGYQGRFSSDVPEGYRDIFLQAGQKWAVQPAFIAAIFYAGEHGETWPTFEDHASLGSALNPKPHHCGSDVGCIRGPMQIGERNWAGWSKGAYGQSTSAERIEWTADAINVAAWHLAMLGAGGNTTKPAKLIDAASIYNSGRPWVISSLFKSGETRNYVKRVTKAFNKFYESPDVGGDANYIPGSGGWSWALANGKEDTACRAVHSCFMLKGIPYCASDLGASEGLSSGSPVLAIGDGTITFQPPSRHYGNDRYLYVRKNGHIAGYNAKFVSSDGKVEAFYAHIYRPKVAIQPSFSVKGGQQFATIYPWNKPDPDHENVYNSHLHFELRVNGYAITCGNQLDKIKEFQGGN